MLRRIALAPCLLLVSFCLHATTYTLEPDYTQGVFRWNHLGFSSPAAQFSQGTGTLEFDPADPARSSVTVTIPLSTLYTGVPALDEDFRSKDFFDTAQFPSATFTSARVEKGATRDRFKLIGELNLHGVTKPVTLEVTVVKVGTNPRTSLATVGFDAVTTLRRSDFGLGKYVPQVSDEIQMRIIVQAVEATSYAAYLKERAAAAAAKAKDAAPKQ
ncbi:MAG TPA: YceI family protein [Steroidobacteraceae bacterium]|nr:YceI family protein [Steroidobacteraceae bacterium]